MKKPTFYLEHSNITTCDIETSLEFLQLAFPSFYIRHQEGEGTNKWIHFGNEETYLALNQGVDNDKIEHNYATNGIKHLGFVVEKLEELGKRLETAGYERSYPIQKHEFRRREYFFDPAGIEYEFVEYFTQKDVERNDYTTN